jgi:D-glycero-D-manno-heptose 1,7-bisphosphate phosphatase
LGVDLGAMSRAAVFVDRDGVLNELVPDARSGLPESPSRPEDVAIISGAAPALVRLRSGGYRIVGVTNQPAAAKGVLGLDELEAIHQHVLELLESEGATFDRFAMCVHHPDGVVPRLSQTCDCRKPAPGMLIQAANELDVDLERSWMVGDTDSDIAAGAAAGVRTIMIVNPASAHKRKMFGSADASAPDLAAAAEIILNEDSR